MARRFVAGVHSWQAAGAQLPLASPEGGSPLLQQEQPYPQKKKIHHQR